MKNIAIITHNLCLGGVQKNVALLANSLAKTYAVTIIVFEDKEIAYTLDESILITALPYFSLNLTNKESRELEQIGRMLFDMRSHELGNKLEESSFDLVIAFEDYHSLCALKTLPMGVKAIISSRASLKYGYDKRFIHLLPPMFYKKMIPSLYPSADHVVAVSEGVKKELLDWGVDATVISNGLNRSLIQKLANEPFDFPVDNDFFLHVGRFYKIQKAQDEVIHAFARVASSLKSALVLIGDGNDRAEVEALVRMYHLEQRVYFVGFDANPYKYMKRCKGFIFSSYYEGMPNVLLEALGLGCPVIAYQFEPSWEEFQHQEGIAFMNKGDIDKLSECMISFEHHPYDEILLRERAEQILQSYDIHKTILQWKQLIVEQFNEENKGSIIL